MDLLTSAQAQQSNTSRPAFMPKNNIRDFHNIAQCEV
jgi:hypothetical protein